MFRNLLAVALRDLVRNRLYAAISIAGLTLGLAAVILTALYVRDELSFDSFIPGHDQAYVVTSTVREPGQGDIFMDYAPPHVAADLKLAFPQIDATARLAYDLVSVRRGEIEAVEQVAWVDPRFFDILPLPALTGDPRRALDDPDAVVITRAVARRYFGRDAPIGETLQFDSGHILRVAAVIKDLPAATHLTQEIFGSSRASFSTLAKLDAGARKTFANYVVTRLPGQVPNVRFEPVRTRVYVRLAKADQAQAADVIGAYRPAAAADLPANAGVTYGLTRLSDLHLQRFKGANLGAGDPRGSTSALYALALIAGLVLALAIINFVNLTTARAGRRAVEVGVRKAAGAQRRHLAGQFVGEAFLHALLAAVLALALVELLLPSINAYLMRELAFPYWREPAMVLTLLALVAGVGVLAGAYPALVLSGFRPVSVLKGGPAETSGSGLVRQGLVVFQFAVLIVLIVAVAVVWRQTRYAMSEGLRLDKDQMLVVYATPCRGAFEAEVRRLPGVKGAGCSSLSMLGLAEFDASNYVMNATAPGGSEAHLDLGLIDFGLLELYGIEPVAGRLFSRGFPGDELPNQPDGGYQTGSVVLNQSAVRKLGFRSAAAAVNRPISVGPGYGEFTTVGVVPDFTLDLVNATVKPTVYVIDFLGYPADQVLNIKLDGARTPETLAAIDRIWKSTGQPGAIRRQFLGDYVQRIYLGTLRQGWLVGALSAIALVLAGSGLLGLAAFTAERRIKEIGVRKAMGAGTADILRLLVWQFTKPVLWANLIAWPAAWIAMDWWLKGFAYRIPLTLWIFAAAALAALLIAWGTVITHALQAARAKPVDALRYE